MIEEADRTVLERFFRVVYEFLQSGVDGPVKVVNITCLVEQKTADKAMTAPRESSLAIW